MNKAESKYFNTAVKFDAALLLLLEKKPFEYITVSEICKMAGVNRSTFYLHYENMHDLLEEATQRVIDRFVSCFSIDAHSVIGRFSDCELSELNFIHENYLYPYLSFIRENRHLFSTVLRQPMTFKTDKLFERLFDHVFNPILDRFHYPQDERRYVMMFYLNGITAIITEWLKGDCNKTVEEISGIIRECIFGRNDKWNVNFSRKE